MPSGVGVHDGGTTGLVGQGHALDAHAEFQVGLRHHPVNVGAFDLDGIGAVSAQSAAAHAGSIGTPDLVADFKEDRRPTEIRRPRHPTASARAAWH